MDRKAIDEMYKLDFAVHQRETFSKVISLEDDSGNKISLTGKSVRAEIRPDIKSNTLTASMTCTVNSTAGVVTIGLTSAQTAAIADGNYVYDVCLISIVNNVEIRRYLMGGIFTVFPSVTH